MEFRIKNFNISISVICFANTSLGPLLLGKAVLGFHVHFQEQFLQIQDNFLVSSKTPGMWKTRGRPLIDLVTAAPVREESKEAREHCQ